VSHCQCGEFTIEDLFDLVFPSEWRITGHLCMIYHCYLDDSKDQKQDQMVVSAGFFGTQKAWGNLRAEWKGRLQKDGLEYFKTSEYKMLNGEFSKFKSNSYPAPTGREAARNLRSDLQRILDKQIGIYGIGVAIPVADYEDVRSRPEAQGVLHGSPYHWALEGIMLGTVNALCEDPASRSMVAFVHDDGEDFDELRAVYKSFKELNKVTAKYMAGFQSLDDKLHPPLQAADMAANYTLGLGQEWLANGRSKPKMKEMEQSIKRLYVWDKNYMLSVLKRQLVRLKRPIPSDLQGAEYD
jgi:hypothetical protein